MQVLVLTLGLLESANSCSPEEIDLHEGVRANSEQKSAFGVHIRLVFAERVEVLVADFYSVVI